MKRILIVEDDQVLSKALSLGLAENGFDILTALNGEDGLELAKSARPDLILLDLVMPKMGGIEMLTELRKDDWGKNADVIILTAVKEMDKVAEVLALHPENIIPGGFEYLIKTDWDLGDIVQKIKNRLEK